jgi:hypothetical protein
MSDKDGNWMDVTSLQSEFHCGICFDVLLNPIVGEAACTGCS